mgnify:CR=1 FL=1
MRERRATKRALLTSIMALVMCVVMLVGTTFAWFTDTATANVNTIKAGDLKLGLEMATAWDGSGNPTAWENARGKTLSFLRMKDNGTVEQNADILWEPGATYRLPELRVSNAGNLNLKYKVQITGIETNRTPTSTANLNDVIDWTITYGGKPLATGSDEYVLNANEAATQYDIIAISGTMKTSANNDYQGLSIDGVAVTVYATQMTGEYDSSKNNYDKDAQYPVYAAAAVEVDAETGLVTKKATLTSGETNADGNPVARATVPAGAKVDSGTTQLELVIEDAETPANFTVSNTQIAPKTLDISMNGLDAANDQLIKVEFYIEEGLQNVELFHNSSPMTACSALVDVDDDQEFYYDSATGLVTMLTKTFSPFTYTSDKLDWDRNTAAEYATPVDTVNKVVTIASAEELALFKYEVTDKKVDYSGYTLNITADIDLGAGFWRPINPVKNLTINGNGHTIRNLLVRSCTNSNNGGYGFGFISNATGALTIKNLTFDGASVLRAKGYENYYSGNVGGIVVAYTYGTTLFENVTVTNSFIGGYGKIGCLLGMGADPGVKVAFKNCVSQNNTIHAVYNIGGLAGNIQRGNGVDNATVENCTVENINVVYSGNEKYVDLNNASATLKSNDKPDGTEVITSVSGKYWVCQGYYWGGYADYYVSYGDSSYDAPVEGHTMKLANSEYPVNK